MMSFKKILLLCAIAFGAVVQVRSAGFIIRSCHFDGFFSKLMMDHKMGAAKVLSNPKLFKKKPKPSEPKWVLYDWRRASLAKLFTHNDDQIALSLLQLEPLEHEKRLKQVIDYNKKKNWMQFAALTLPYQKPVSEEERKKRFQKAIEKYTSRVKDTSMADTLMVKDTSRVKDTDTSMEKETDASMAHIVEAFRRHS